MEINLEKDLLWNDNYNGCDLGYDEINIIGYYTLISNEKINFYISEDNCKILKVFDNESNKDLTSFYFLK
jgi:hypothetical protein